jgi:hypothetical protein
MRENRRIKTFARKRIKTEITGTTSKEKKLKKDNKHSFSFISKLLNTGT